MKIINEYPPVYPYIIQAGLTPNDQTIFTYGDAIYNPHNVPITPDVEVHERVHMKQQRNYGGADRWWLRYLIDPKFRLEQELEAYREQYVFICKVEKDRNKQYRILLMMAGFLSGPMYANLITRSEAIEAIKGK